MAIRISKKSRADARAEFLVSNWECTLPAPQFSFSSWEPMFQKINSGALHGREREIATQFFYDWEQELERYNFYESKTVLSEEMIQSYRETVYSIYATEQFELRVNEYSAHLAELYKYFKCQSSAFITGFNPFSMVTDDVKNLEKNIEVSEFLKDNSFVFFARRGQASK